MGANLSDTIQMASFLEALDHLTEADLLRMRAAWRAVGKREHEAAWRAVRAAGVRDGLSNEIDRVRKRALAWATRGSNSIPYRMNSDDAWTQIKIEAAEPIVDVALAIALGDRLDETTRMTLLVAWNRP